MALTRQVIRNTAKNTGRSVSFRRTLYAAQNTEPRARRVTWQRKKPSRSSLVEQICDVKNKQGNWFENLSEDDKLLCLEVREFCHENNRNRAAVARNLRASIDTDVGTKSIIEWLQDRS